jgi:choice-of-anchor B domain-containing protein
MRYLYFLLALLFLGLPAFGQGQGAAVAAADDVLFVGEAGNRVEPGMVFMFERGADDAWMESGMLTSDSGSADEDGFGRSMAASGDVLSVGAPVEEAVYVFERGVDGTWSQTARLTGFGESFGSAVATDGARIAVVAEGGGEDSPGMAHVFTRMEDGSWPMTGHVGSESIGYEMAGSQIALDEEWILLSAPMAADRAGKVLVFRENPDVERWDEVQELEMPVAGQNQMFGSALYLHHGHAMVGAPGYESRIGAVGVYHYDEESDSFGFTLRMSPPTASGNEGFGSAFAHDPDHNVWVGAPGADGRNGAVHSFDPSNMMRAFSPQGAVAVDGLQIRTSFGASFAAGADFIAVGAPGYDNGEGGVFVYNQADEGMVQSTVVFHDKGAMDSFVGEMVECEDGDAAGFRCQDVDVQSFLSLRDIGGVRGTRMNDIWGWTDPGSGREFALVGRTDGTAFIETTDPYNPVYLGNLAKTEGATNSVWRDIKVYQDHAYIVADGAGQHGMQVFDLSRLLNVPGAPVEFEADVMYDQIASAHNIVINEETGYGYSVASRMGGITCGGGLHMIDLREPKNPTFAGCFSHEGTGRNNTGNTHDAQCVIYRGPDTEHNGREICLGSNETALSIADVTDKDEPFVVAMATYPAIAYTHQGWLTEDMRYFYINDEGDEPQGLVDGTRTLIFDLIDLDDPVLVGEHISTETSTDHNLYIRDNLMYQSNYVAGLRILDVSNPEAPTEVAFFDTVSNDRTGGGSWSNYPYFESRTIVVTSSREGLFMLKKREVDL